MSSANRTQNGVYQLLAYCGIVLIGRSSGENGSSSSITVRGY